MMFRCAVVAAVCVALLVPGAIAQDRASAVEKGSVLVYPKVELRFDASANLIQDTFITINNDYNDDVEVQMYFVCEQWNVKVDNKIRLTGNEAAYWSAATGLPKGVSPWEVLDCMNPDPDQPDTYVIRGFILAWAVDAEGLPISWNHLFGGATLVNYDWHSAWEYNAYTFQEIDPNIAHGDQTYVPAGGEEFAVIQLDGDTYDYGFSELRLDFFATGSYAFTRERAGFLYPPCDVEDTGVEEDCVNHETDLTLLILNNDLRQDGEGPGVTKVEFLVYNENEVGFSNARYCIACWDQRYISRIFPQHFLCNRLGTDHGYARIWGNQSIECDTFAFPYLSSDQSLLGVSAKILTFDEDCDEDNDYYAQSGTNLFGAGTMEANIYYDVQVVPPTSPTEPQVQIQTATPVRARR